MNAHVAIPDKIVPLVARLGSDSDDERLACLRQLDRLLCKAGLTWTDFASVLSSGAPSGDPTGPFRHWRVAVQWIINHADWEPSEREYEFVLDMRRFLKRRGPTAKQANWLRGIVERSGGEIDV